MDEMFLAREIAALKSRIIELEERIEQAAFFANDPENNVRNGSNRDVDLWHRWKIEPETDPAALAIGAGTWTRNGIPMEFAGGQPAGAWAVGANYIKMRLDSATAPTSITAVVEATAAAVDGTELVIAVAMMAGGVLTDISQRRYSDVADSWSTALSVAQTWEGETCRPVLTAGSFWYLDSVSLVAGVLTLNMEQMCLPLADEPGYCPASGSFTLSDENELPLNLNFTDGYCDATEGTIIRMGTADGETVTVTVGASGELTGYVGKVAIGDPNTGTTSYYRISSDGKLEE